MKWVGDECSFELGDQFHFRSALVIFRRIWMAKEPSSFYPSYNVLYKHSSDTAREWLKHWRARVSEIEQENPHQRLVGRPAKEIINAWINSVFAHTTLKTGGSNRHAFEKLVGEFGIAPVEYCCRHSVWSLCLQYINMGSIHAGPFLEAAAAIGVTPSFTIGIAFGDEPEETTRDGHRITRKPTSRFLPNESVEDAIKRIMARSEYRPLSTLLKHLGSKSEQVVELMKSNHEIEHIVTESNRELLIEEYDAFREPSEGDQGFNVFVDIERGRKAVTAVSSKMVRMTEVAEEVLNRDLIRFRHAIATGS